LLRAVDDPAVLGRLTRPLLGRLLARRGDAGAAQVLDRAWDVAVRADAVIALAPAGLAKVEWAWLRADIALASPQIEVLLARTGTPGTVRWRGELLRYMSRAGLPAAPFDGCAEEFAAGLRGDWQAAAMAWRRIGDPYEEALELIGSGEPDTLIAGLATLDRLGATEPARFARQRLRDLGHTRVPRGPAAAIQSNPAGLTDRQLDVLALLADGLTNAEIGERLAVSTRTVDHHVSAILAKLGVTSRQEAARAASERELVRV
jgi:DNA-binding CsgD family transcriptional regulator